MLKLKNIFIRSRMGNGMLLAVVCLAIAAGCATMESTRRKFVQARPDLSDAEKNAVLKGELIPGMTEDMVRASWGAPVDIIPEIIGGKQVSSWIYQQYSGDHVNTFRVRFTEGRVNAVRLIKMQPYGTPIPRAHRRHWWRYYPEMP